MQPTMETRSSEAENGWRDRDGFVGPMKPGNGPRSDPKGNFPTGPAVGTPMPAVISTTADGTPFDLHKDRGNRAAIFIFYRSAVW
ncbi:MAG TPA: hypothetical protein DER02_11970 [Gammaproteobacteria bacterium]|nr:hypothetical protein [Gammaproteobacteria bacterium]|tara:strand:- start:448 stop:702 length:255 start_codon:yes stop_codon:yes gene_type:complete